MNPFAVWLYWSTVWAKWTALWWKLALSPPDGWALTAPLPNTSALTTDERNRLEILRERFAAEVAHRQAAAQENAP